MDSNLLRKKLTEVIGRKELSIYKIEKEAGIPRAVLQNFISGRVKEPKIDVILAVSKFLEIDIDDLLSESVLTIIDDSNHIKPNDSNILDKKILLDCVKFLIDYTNKKNISITFEDGISLIKKTYDYSKTYSNKFDKTFMEWCIENRT